MKKRAIIIVLDGCGIGASPDAKDFSDTGADTLGHIDSKINDFSLPFFQSCGLGCLREFKHVLCEITEKTKAFGKCEERSLAKDTIIGHWEITGLVTPFSFPLFPDGFPIDFIKSFENAVQKKVIGNKAASGTEIINELGREHLETKALIVYTSADSVLQIAAHKKVISVSELYDICHKAREMLTGSLGVGRVIARPFEGREGSFVRTHERRDFSLLPHGKTLLDIMVENGLKTFGIGKIHDIYANVGLSDYIKTVDNSDGVKKTLKAIKEKNKFDLIYTNLVDTDMLYGHRRDERGFYNALKEIDDFFPQIMDALLPEDILFITADHGCDPSFSGTDHTREYVPLFVLGKEVLQNVDLGIRSSFADIGKTIAGYFKLSSTLDGKSFLNKIIKIKA